MLNSPGWAEVQSDRLSLQDGLYKFHLLIDEPTGLVFLAGKHLGWQCALERGPFAEADNLATANCPRSA